MGKFAGYRSPTIVSDKTLISEFNQALLRRFKSDAAQSSTIEVFPTSRLPGVLVSKPVTYSKERVSDLVGCELDFVTKDKEFDSFVWHTNAAKLREASRLGILKTQSLTSQVIGALGQYRMITLERMSEGYVSNRYRIKEALVTHYQDRIEALQVLESLANHESTHTNDDAAMNALDKYIQTLVLLESRCATDFSVEKIGMEYDLLDKKGILHLQQELRDDIKRAKEFKLNVKNNRNSSKRSTGIDSALTFVKRQAARDLRRLQNHNQNITYTRKMRFALTRGDLNSAIEDAMKLVEDYKAPPRDSVYKDHHGNYQEKPQHLYYDSSYHCASPAQEQKALLAISFIDGVHKITFDGIDLNTAKPIPMMHTKNGPAQKMRVVNASKWTGAGSVARSVMRVIAFALNIIYKLVMGVIELPVTLVIEPLLVELPYALFSSRLEKSKVFSKWQNLFKGFRKAAMAEITLRHPGTLQMSSEKLQVKAARPHQTLGLRLRHFAANAFRNTIQDIIYGVRDIYKQFSIRFFDSVIDDYMDGDKEALLQDVSKAIEDAAKDMNIITERTREDLSVLLSKLYKDKDEVTVAEVGAVKNQLYPGKQDSNNEADEAFAIPGFHPSAGNFGDLCNAGADGFDQFMAFFNHNIHAKHPFIGTLFTASYIFGGLAVLWPEFAARFLSTNYIVYSQVMGYSMSKSPLTAAISSACTQGQMSSTVVELLLHGNKSWVAANAAEFEKDPFTSLIYGATAIGLGYLMVYQFDVPGMSEVLREDMGTFPPSSLAFVGAKLGILVYELLAEHAEKHHQDEENSINLDEELFKENKELSQQIEKIKLLHFLFKNEKHLSSLSSRSKRGLVWQMNRLFDSATSRSLAKMLYPEESRSIFRETLVIVLSYPVYALRWVLSFGSSLLRGNTRPLQSASKDFGLKILSDVTRLSRAIGHVLKVCFLFVRRQCKAFMDVFVNSLFARSEAVLGNSHHVANAGYAASAYLDQAMEWWRQLVGTPVDRMVKEVTVADATDTRRKTYDVYIKLLRHQPAGTSPTRPATDKKQTDVVVEKRNDSEMPAMAQGAEPQSPARTTLRSRK